MQQSPHPNYNYNYYNQRQPAPPTPPAPKRNGGNGWKYFFFAFLAVILIGGGIYYWVRDDRVDNVNMTDLAAEERSLQEKRLRDSLASEAAVRRAEQESRQREADMQKALDDQHLRLEMSRALVGKKYGGYGRLSGEEKEMEFVFKQDGNVDCYADWDHTGEKSYYPGFYSVDGKEVEIRVKDYNLPFIMSDDFCHLTLDYARVAGDDSMLLDRR